MMKEICSVAARRRGDQLLGTASRVDRWLLVEHPGPWGPASVPTARMRPAVAAWLTARAAQGPARLVLLRRPATPTPRRTGDPDRRHVYCVDARPGSERLLATTVADDEDLLTLDLPYGADPDPRWTPLDQPLLLVCTHGRHDVCCALRGRPVAAALAARRPEQTWECSHIGGDRFAANLVVLPQGLYFGAVSPAEAVALAAAVEQGWAPVEHVRGRSSLSAAGQAAQQYARLATGRLRLDDLLPVAQTPTGRTRWRVVLAGTAGPDVQVDVVHDPQGDGEPVLLTCDAREGKVAPVFRLAGLELLGP